MNEKDRRTRKKTQRRGGGEHEEERKKRERGRGSEMERPVTATKALVSLPLLLSLSRKAGNKNNKQIPTKVNLT